MNLGGRGEAPSGDCFALTKVSPFNILPSAIQDGSEEPESPSDVDTAA